MEVQLRTATPFAHAAHSGQTRSRVPNTTEPARSPAAACRSACARAATTGPRSIDAVATPALSTSRFTTMSATSAGGATG